MSQRFAVIGNPVSHSQSPFIHHQFATQLGLEIEYGRIEAPLDGFETTVRRWAESGARGCNITVPFKFEAPRLAAGCTPRAALAGAANTLRFDTQGWQADNTDGQGLVTDIEVHAGFAVRGSTVLMIGAGGAACGVLGPLLAAGPRRVVVANRTAARAAALVASHQQWAQAHSVGLHACGLEEIRSVCPQGCELLVNSSSSSLSESSCPAPQGVLRPGGLAVDLMYGVLAEPFLRWAEAQGAIARDGLGMLVEQAAEAFRFWMGERPLTAPVLQALRVRLAQAGA